MEDRISKYPGRVVLRPVEGLPDTYTLVRADSPEVEGTPLNKETLLEDEVVELLGLPVGNDTPSKALKVLAKAVERLGFYGESMQVPATTLLSDFNANGFYRWNYGQTPADAPFEAGSMIVSNYGPGYVVQIAVRADITTLVIKARKSWFSDGTNSTNWTEWEDIYPALGSTPLDEILVEDSNASPAAFGRKVDEYCTTFSNKRAQVKVIRFRDYKGLGVTDYYCGLLYYHNDDYMALLGFGYNGQLVLKVKSSGMWYKWHVWTTSLEADVSREGVANAAFFLDSSEVDVLGRMEVLYDDTTLAVYTGSSLAPFKEQDPVQGIITVLPTTPAGNYDYALTWEGSYGSGWELDPPTNPNVPIPKTIYLYYYQ